MDDTNLSSFHNVDMVGPSESNKSHTMEAMNGGGKESLKNKSLLRIRIRVLLIVQLGSLLTHFWLNMLPSKRLLRLAQAK